MQALISASYHTGVWETLSFCVRSDFLTWFLLPCIYLSVSFCKHACGINFLRSALVAYTVSTVIDNDRYHWETPAGMAATDMEGLGSCLFIGYPWIRALLLSLLLYLYFPKLMGPSRRFSATIQANASQEIFFGIGLEPIQPLCNETTTWNFF